MDEETPVTISTIAHKISIWIGIGGALFSILTFCMFLGMWLGPIKEMPNQFGAILAQLGEIKEKVNRTVWRTDDLQAKYEALSTQLQGVVIEQKKFGEDSKKLEVMLAQLSVTTVQKVDFLEWKAELERRNNIIAPQLRKSP
jgi:regulator of replication initiation timing